MIINEKKFELCLSIDKCKNINYDDYYAEVKYDGTRIFLFIKDGKVIRLLNRRGFNPIDKYPKIRQIKIPCKSCCIDGELVVLNGLKTSLFEVSNKDNWDKVTLMAFDLIELNGEDLRNLPIEERKEKLYELLSGLPFKEIMYSPNYKPNALWKIVTQNGLEGMVLKKKGSKYLGYRSGVWIKKKNKQEAIVEFNGYEIHNAGITLTSTEHSTRVTCNGEQSKEVKSLIDKKGKAKVEIEYLYLTPEGNFYQPTYKRVVTKSL